MRTICIKTRIEKKDIEGIQAWFQELRRRLDETLESLENEGVLIESAFLDDFQDEWYLVYYMKAESIERAYEVFDSSTLPIDQFYKECWKKYCKGRFVFKELMDLERL